MLAGLLILFIPGTLPYPAWRSTIVIGVSIPLSILSALALMQWLPPLMNGAFGDIAAGEGAAADIFTFILRLAPENLTLNIMTLSGLTVAVGRVVDDSIVVLENIFRQMQSGMDKREAILSGTRDVSAAIFSATGIAVVVFLPLGLTGGLIGEFFLPFGLAVTYALLSSFLVAITVVPVVSYIFVNVEDIPEEQETWMQRVYVPVLGSVLSSPVLRYGVIAVAFASIAISAALFANRPFAFLPDFGEPQISVNVELPSGTPIIETNEKVEAFEAVLQEIVAEDQLSTVSTIIGSGALGLDSLIGGGGGGVSENLASVTISIRSSDVLEASIPAIEEKAQEIFGEENVSVAGGTIGGGGFGGFELIATGSDPAVLAELDPQIIETLNNVDGLENVSSNLSAAAQDTGGPTTYIRVNAAPAISYTGEVTTEDTIGIATDALDAIAAEIELPEGVDIDQGFDSKSQEESFVGLGIAIVIALIIVVIILLLVFQSAFYWFALILSVAVAPFGAAVALTITDRVLGISALIGMLMLLGLVVTNAIVLIDRVASNRQERGMGLYDALMEAGARRVRPILMTAIATIIALMPLAIGLSDGAIIASELGTVVIGGVISSTLLTLIVVPAAYYALTPFHDFFAGIFSRGNRTESSEKAK
ncbi:MAG: efflux RND transporter permease subunit [Aggregatilineales bacterium]